MEEFRMQYPLSAASLVLDVGAYRGDYIADCRTRWGCRVMGFEAVGEFAQHVKARFVGDPHVRVFEYGLGALTEDVHMSMRNDSTSAYGIDVAHPVITAHIRDVVEVFDHIVGAATVDLMKINIEGGEYPLLDRMLETGLIEQVRFFQIQFHGMGAGPEGAAPARDRIRRELGLTHREEWCLNGGQWESWSRC